MTVADLRARMVSVARDLAAKGLSPVRSGNLSIRQGTDGALLISASGKGLHELTAADFAAVDGAGGPALGGAVPSSEAPMHRAVYLANPAAEAIVHLHAPHATAVAATGEGVPPFHYMIAITGAREIPCAPYALFGSEALAEVTGKTMTGRRACLLANHGLIASGPNIEAAAELAEEIENLCRQYILARQAGTVRRLSDADMDAAIERFKTYGQRGKG